MASGFSNCRDEMYVNIQERAIRGRGASACFKPCLEMGTWKYLVACAYGVRGLSSFPSEFTTPAGT